MSCGFARKSSARLNSSRYCRCPVLVSDPVIVTIRFAALLCIFEVFTFGFAPTGQLFRHWSTISPITSRSMALQEDQPVWDPIQQIYLGGKVPGASDAEVTTMIQQSGLRVFGYGSLTWKPSGWLQNGIPGRIYGYRRAWAQKSTDHRGNPNFPGLVCTLLTEVEVKSVSRLSNTGSDKGFVEGLVYYVPDSHADDCLKDLDFREKGVRFGEYNCKASHQSLDIRVTLVKSSML